MGCLPKYCVSRSLHSIVQSTRDGRVSDHALLERARMEIMLRRQASKASPDAPLIVVKAMCSIRSITISHTYKLQSMTCLVHNTSLLSTHDPKSLM